MKGLALSRMKDKDSYDILSVAQFYGRGPRQASDAFMIAVEQKGSGSAVVETLGEIKDAFASLTSQDPSAVVRFIGSEYARNDLLQLVSKIIRRLRI
jgi:hypothetical protein